MNEDGAIDFWIFPDDMSEEDRKAFAQRIRAQAELDIYTRSPEPVYVPRDAEH